MPQADFQAVSAAADGLPSIELWMPSCILSNTAGGLELRVQPCYARVPCVGRMLVSPTRRQVRDSELLLLLQDKQLDDSSSDGEASSSVGFLDEGAIPDTDVVLEWILQSSKCHVVRELDSSCRQVPWCRAGCRLFLRIRLRRPQVISTRSLPRVARAVWHACQGLCATDFAVIWSQMELFDCATSTSASAVLTGASVSCVLPVTALCLYMYAAAVSFWQTAGPASRHPFSAGHHAWGPHDLQDGRLLPYLSTRASLLLLGMPLGYGAHPQMQSTSPRRPTQGIIGQNAGPFLGTGEFADVCHVGLLALVF